MEFHDGYPAREASLKENVFHERTNEQMIKQANEQTNE